MDQILKVVKCLAQRNPSQFSRSILELCEKRAWADLQRIRLNPSDYGFDTESYWRDAMVLDVLRKCKLPSTVNTEQVATEAFWSLERTNASTNARLNRYVSNSSLEPQDIPVMDFISSWRKNINRCLGNLPEGVEPRFSGGATVGDVGKLKTIPDKMSSLPQWYKRSVSVWEHEWRLTSWFRTRCHAGEPFPHTVRANVFFTVPKDGTKDRGCCKEASVSLSYQLGIARVIRARLRRWGICLESGQEKHKKLARESSVSGEFATIDMSDASDRWSRRAVELALGPTSPWFYALDSLRAPCTIVGDRTVYLEKFSSMGNGFTFELETLLFAGLARTVVEGEGGNPDLVSCFGDDLIVPTRHTRSVLAALRFFGHSPNERKTFYEGPFRESCGGDYFCGVPVRTVKLEVLPDEPHKWIAFANQLRAVCDGIPSRWAMVKPAWETAIRCLPSQLRACRGPSDLGDLVIHDSEEFWNTRGQGWETTVRAWVPFTSTLPWKHWRASVQMACVTLCPSRGITPRDGVAGYRLRWLYIHRNHWTPS